MTIEEDKTRITTRETGDTYDVFIDARGQKALKTNDLPFPTLREQLERLATISRMWG